MPRQKTITLYKYNELSDAAKEKARQWFLEGTYDDAQFAFDDMKEDAKNIGLELTAWEYGRYARGRFIGGALECAEAVLKEHGETCETYKTAKEHAAKLRQFSEDDADETSCEYDALKEAESEFLRALLEDYRVMLDKEMDHRQSEEYIAETIEANEYEFYENGEKE